MSLRFRLNLLITVLSIGFIFSVGYVILSGTKASIQEGVEASTRVSTQLLDTVIVSSVQNPEWGYTHDVLQRFLQSLGHVRGSEFTLYGIGGEVLYHSPPSRYKIEENPPRWFVQLLTPEEKPVTRFVRFGRLEIQPNPIGAIREAWGKARHLFFIGITFFILVNVLVYWTLGHSLRPLGDMLKAINSIEQGKLDTRLPEFNLPEFERIGHSLNRMAESLTAERQLEENRQLTALIQKHIEDERRSLARELHDELGQYVTAIKTFAVSIANKASANAAATGMTEIASGAQVIVSAANQIYDGMHNIIRQLRPGSLDNLGLVETLKDVVSTYQSQHPDTQIHFKLSSNLAALSLQQMGETLSINFYRIVQESLNNALKYSQATKIDVALSKVEHALELTIEDNGVGMNVDAVDQTRHFGLLGMRERAQALNGTFNIISTPNKGTKIMISVPYNNA